MKKNYAVLILLLVHVFAAAQNEATVKVDKKGVMRWTDTNKEASFYGVNYTLPFAHAYRAAGYLHVDRKQAIDQDVYHFARLGFNAYRIHIWDVEVSDANGHLLENDHLDLLDYLIARLKERDIKIVITAQTDFGNGYPERNQQTGGFSYHFEKCDVHSNPEAIAAQETYLSELVSHVNPYTGEAYMNDPDVVGFEVNNEPCHSGTAKQTEEYINRMLAAMKGAGNQKPVFYNVSHNGHLVEAYYATDVQGTTYQWYPIGLVSGHTRQGNFLPYVDEYPIPFSNVDGFDQKAKLVYEFDPADIMYSYMYPAMARSFRSAGFQWITHFAYDPMFMASANTEYQTHYLNLAYTPGKALSMKIAAEAARELPLNQAYGTFPADTVFGDFRVSYREDLSEMNATDKFFYSNNTRTQPKAAKKLEAVAGVGSSPVVDYEGTGAYFLDKLEDGSWRLEVMPDAVQVGDPFAKPSLDKAVIEVIWGKWNMTVNLPDLGKEFTVLGLNEGNNYQSEAHNGTIASVGPGVYLLQKSDSRPKQNWTTQSQWQNIALGEYVAPKPNLHTTQLYHQAASTAPADKELTIKALVVADEQPDSVLIYTNRVSFWNTTNPYFKMNRTRGYSYEAQIPTAELQGNSFNYTVVIFSGETKMTFPAGIDRSPLDWDYTASDFYQTKLVQPADPFVLYKGDGTDAGLETHMLPKWGKSKRTVHSGSPAERNWEQFYFESDQEKPAFFLRKYIADQVALCTGQLAQANYLCVQLKNNTGKLQAGFVNANGFTYLAPVSGGNGEVVKIPLSALTQTNTALLPLAYPEFMKHYFTPESQQAFDIREIEILELRMDGEKQKAVEFELGSIWLE